MESKIETCSQCGNYVSGNIVRTNKQEITRTIAKKGTNKILIYLVGIILGNFIFPIVGTILGLIVCFIIGIMIDNYSNKATNAIEESLFKTFKYEYFCPKCGHKWVRYLSKNDDYTPIEVLRKEKNEIISKLYNSKTNQTLMSCICGLLTVSSFIYCKCNEYKTSLGIKEGIFGIEYEDFDYNYLWYFLCLVCIFSIIGFIFHLNKLIKVTKTIRQIKDLTDNEFRYSALRFKYKES